MMTKKHFILLAAALFDVQPDSNTAAHTQWLLDLGAIATALQKNNPRFNLTRFVTAARQGS